MAKTRSIEDIRKELEGVETPADIGNVSYPSIAWLSGKQGMTGHWRYDGHFFISEDQGVEIYGTDWKKTEYITDKGKVIPGYINPKINCSVIRVRRAWFAHDEREGNTVRFPWDCYKQAERIGEPRGKMQIVMAVDGVKTLCALTLKGHHSKHAVERNGWGDRARREIYDASARILGIRDRMPALCFKISLATQENPKFITVGKGDKQSSITPIQLIGVKVTEANVESVIVPRVLRQSYEIAYREADEWYNAWQKREETVNDDGYTGTETDVE